MNSIFGNTPPVTKNLIIANCIIYLAMYLIPSVYNLFMAFGCLYPIGTPTFHPWQFISYMFLHSSPAHIFFNMFALWMFGRATEYILGSKRFAALYFISGIGSALFQIGVAALFGGYSNFILLGASGAIMGVLAASAMLRPNDLIIIFPIPFPVRAKWMIIIYATLEVSLGLFYPGAQIAHFAHVGGMFFGYVMIQYWRHKRVIW